MAFDEDFHLGLIKIYSNHLSPFWNAHLEGSEAYGAISRDPSYLYHLLFGGIYKVLKIVTSDLYTQVIILRLFNIALFASGLFIFKKLLLKTNMSLRLVNYVFLVFILIPVVPLLAAQINYDNLMFPVVGLILLNTLKIGQDLKAGKIHLIRLLVFSALVLVASIIKYAFLPIALACLIYLIFIYRHQIKASFSFDRLKKTYKKSSKLIIFTLVAFNIVLAGLFIERYGLNLVNYHKPIADCAEVLDYEKCQAYGPWIRDYNFEQTKQKNANTSVAAYIPEWVYGMWFRSFFSVDGPGTRYQTRGPLILPGLISIAFLAVSPFIIFYSWRKILIRYDKSTIYLFVTAILIYVLSLWIEEYRLFRKTAQPVAINGRYLILVMPLLLSLVAMSFNELINNLKVKYFLATVTVVMLAWGGGALTYVLRSNPDWYWQNSNLINHVNYTAKRSIGPIVPGYYIGNFLQK